MKTNIPTALAFLTCLLLSSWQVFAQDKLLSILEEEVNREFSILKNQEVPAYYIAYSVEESYGYSVSALFGSLTYSDDYKSKVLTITIRVGTPQLDNFHPLRDKSDNSGRYSSIIELPEENDPLAIKTIIWKATSNAYEEAVAQLSKVKSNVSVKIDEEDKSADFLMGKPNRFEEPEIKPGTIKFNVAEWENRVKKYSAEFLKDSAIFLGASSASYSVQRKCFVSSNGDRIAQNRTVSQSFIQGVIKASDGMEMPLYKSFLAYKPEGLSSDKEMQMACEKIVKNLIVMKNAPVAEPYSGPAMLSAEASGVFFHEIFGHRVEGQRLKNENDAQTFKKKIGEMVLPATLSVYCDPQQKSYEGIDLNGYYQYDDQGSKGERVNIVENGILKNFLMTLSPIKGFEKTNGHARAQAGMQPISRQSNLVIESSDLKTNKELREELIRIAKEQGRPYGYLFEDVQGGFTTTGRYSPSSFNVTPTLVYRVYTDGRPDEIIRGVDLIGTPLAMFSQIIMAGGNKGVFNGTCGAESGAVPVSGCSPMILVKVIETQKKSKSQELPYILPRPDASK
ncbi:MAG TPA: metallopeptidase TldD-related protein [Bacteroidales bacterium]|nr:metallopeptidase TldD-related protein [Bacteroidales bacterium]